MILRSLATASITLDLIYLPLSALVVGLTAITFIGVRWLEWEYPKAGALITTDQ